MYRGPLLARSAGLKMRHRVCSEVFRERRMVSLLRSISPQFALIIDRSWSLVNSDSTRLDDPKLVQEAFFGQCLDQGVNEDSDRGEKVIWSAKNDKAGCIFGRVSEDVLMKRTVFFDAMLVKVFVIGPVKILFSNRHTIVAGAALAEAVTPAILSPVTYRTLMFQP